MFSSRVCGGQKPELASTCVTVSEVAYVCETSAKCVKPLWSTDVNVS